MLRYLWYRIFIIIAGVTAICFSTYYYVHRNKKPYYKYYWQGFLLVFAGTSISLLRMFYPIRFLALIVLQMVLLILGLIVVLYGAFVEKKIKKA